MPALGFDFAARRERTGWVGWLVLVLGILLAADLARTYVSLQHDVLRLESRLSRPAPAVPDAAAAGGEVNPDELAAARAVVQRFARPWPALFSAIESVRPDGVSLLSIEPDAATGNVLITGEAKSYLAALTYVAQLGIQPGLSRVHLSRHEVRDKDPRAPVSFSVLARWGRT